MGNEKSHYARAPSDDPGMLQACNGRGTGGGGGGGGGGENISSDPSTQQRPHTTRAKIEAIGGNLQARMTRLKNPRYRDVQTADWPADEDDIGTFDDNNCTTTVHATGLKANPEDWDSGISDVKVTSTPPHSESTHTTPPDNHVTSSTSTHQTEKKHLTEFNNSSSANARPKTSPKSGKLNLDLSGLGKRLKSKQYQSVSSQGDSILSQGSEDTDLGEYRDEASSDSDH